MSDEVYIEVWGLYDGWACIYNTDTKEFTWRTGIDRVDNFPAEKRKLLEQKILTTINTKQR